MILRPRSLLAPDGRVREGALVVEGGFIRRVLLGARALRHESSPGGVVDLGDGLLAPGFVNAHAHLELGRLHGRLPSACGFVDWLRAILVERGKLSRLDFEEGVRSGARRALQTGTTGLGDIASVHEVAPLRRGALRAVVYREILDGGDPLRAEAALRRLSPSLPPRRLRREGLSPHAPYTLSANLTRLIAERLARRPMPLSIHWAETEEEVAWLERGEGPLAAVCRNSPRCSPLEHLDRGGLLRGTLSLVHGNHPRPGDLEVLAERGAVVVHCPGSHAYFDRPTFPLETYRSAGVPVALGTDSLASNEDLDMRRELALLRAAHPQLTPAEAVRMATVEGARALGLAGCVGELAPGRLADLAFHRVDPRDPLEALTAGEGEVEGVWVGGRRVSRTLSDGLAQPAGGSEAEASPSKGR